MNFNIVMLSLSIAVIMSANASMSRQDISREMNEVKHKFLQQISSINCTGQDLIRNTRASLIKFRDLKMQKASQKFNNVEHKLQTIMDEKNTIENNSVYSRCFEDAKEKLKERFDNITRVNCTKTDMAAAWSVIKHMKTTIDTGYYMIENFDTVIFNCPAEDVGYAACAEEELNQMRNWYEDFKRICKDSKALAKDTKEINTFPCFKNRALTFSRHAKMLKFRGRKCMQEKDLKVLEYTEEELLKEIM